MDAPKFIYTEPKSIRGLSLLCENFNFSEETFTLSNMGKNFNWPEDNGSEINPLMTPESVKTSCYKAREARVKMLNQS